MSSYAHEQSQYDDFMDREKETSKISVNNECRHEKELLTKSWVEQQRIRTDEPIQAIISMKDSKDARNNSVNSILDTRYNGNRDQHSNGSVIYSIHENRLEDSGNTNRETLLTERRFKQTEPNSPYINSDVTPEISGVVLRSKLEDIHLQKEALKLPLLSKSPLISPCGSPCASPRSSVHGGSDSSAASSPGDSPAPTPKGRVANSLPRNFVHGKGIYADDGVQVTRSLPGSPVIRRSLLGRPSDSNDHLMRRQLSVERETNGRDPNISNHIIDNLNGGLPFQKKKAQASLSVNSRLCPRRPGTPITRDLRPGLRVCQLSKSMSDLGAITEKSTEDQTRRDHHGLFPSIIAK